MKIVSVGSSGHDASYAFFDTDLKDPIEFASATERYNREKKSKHWPKQCTDAILNRDYDILVSNESRQFASKFFPSEMFDKVSHWMDHHEAHVASAFYTRPWKSYEDTVIMVIDGQDGPSVNQGYSRLISNSIWKYDGKKFIKLDEDFAGYGGVYKVISNTWVGLGEHQEGSVMALHALGEYNELYAEMFEHLREHHIAKRTHLLESSKINDFDKTGLKTIEKYFPKKALRAKHNLGLILSKTDPNWQANLAHTVQKLTMDHMVEYANLARKYGSKLCFAGGVAQNIMGNSLIRDIFDDMHMPSDPSDGGLPLGVGLHEWSKCTGKNRIDLENAYLGYDIKQNVDPKQVVDYILKHKVCGIANGKAEWGPRALGNRSLIGDVRYDIKDTVNKIKRRQSYRPFGPVILKEEFDKWFEGHTNGYMQYVCKPKHEHKSVIHIDGTSRVQTVPSNSKSVIRPILEEYYERTGVPMLLNTSLNIKGQPMVNDENHAKDFERKYGVKVF